MKFSTAWARVAAQNVSLKLATTLLSIVGLAQLGIIGGLASRDPLVIERSCYSRVVTAKAQGPNADEIKAFLSEAIPMRFDSAAYVKDGFLSIEESVARDKEQATLKQRQMIQRVLLTEMRVEGKDIVAFADRLIAVGKVKSALALNLKVTVQQTNRTEANPYGLVLTNISQIEEKGDKQ